MKDNFVITRNVKKFQMAAQRINHNRRGVERMALVTGEVGLGKTEASLWYGAQSGAIIIRMWELMSGRWLLREIVKEIGIEPAWHTEKLVDQLKRYLYPRPRTIILDEVDRFLKDDNPKKTAVLETLRDIHDVCHCPMVFVGEKWIDKKMKRFPRLYDRIVEIARFEKLDADDVRHFIRELSEYRFSDDAIETIAQESDGRVRPIMNLINRAEDIARIKQLRMITERDLR
jgi:chromosomal replication initiation ATPase DnaA